MPSSYTPLLRLTLPADGELVGTWGQTVNNGITSLEEAAIAGTVVVPVTDGADTVLTQANGAADQARYATLRFTGALTAQRNVIVPATSKNYFVRNATTGGFLLNVKTAGGTGVALTAGAAMLLYCDGVNVVDAINAHVGMYVSGGLRVDGGYDGNPDLLLKSSGTTKVWVKAGGNVGIGDAAPAAKLTVAGTIRADFGAGTGVSIVGTGGLSNFQVNHTSGSSQVSLQNSGAVTGANMAFAGSSIISMLIDDNGNLGLGTTAPTAVANYKFLSISGASGSYVEFRTGATIRGTLGVEANAFGMSAGPGLPMIFNTNATERMRIFLNGSVGIGNGSDSLVLVGLTIGNSARIGENYLRMRTSTVDAYFGQSGGTIFNCPTGTIAVVLNDGASKLGIGTQTANELIFGTGGTERARITASGDFGIGTTGPGARFAVVGNMRSDCGNITVTSLTLTGGQSNLQVAHNLNSGRVTLLNTGSDGIAMVAGANGVLLPINGTSWGVLSDERVKTDLRPLEEACAKVATLRAVSGRYVKDAEQGYTRRRTFLIAQDVQDVLPEAVYKTEGDDMLRLAYTEVIPLLVAAIKELNTRLAAFGG